MCAYVTTIMVVLIIFPIILQTVINFKMMSTERQGGKRGGKDISNGNML